MNNLHLNKKELIEIDFWQNSPTENPDSDSLANIVNKMGDVEVFLECFYRVENKFITGQLILELGGGQGWASCVIKRMFPTMNILTTDISQAAVASLPKWEHIFNVEIKNPFATKSYHVPIADNSIDTIFCFASAHHFIAHRRTLQELRRCLKQGGNAFYFYEPSTPDFWYRIAKNRVERKRPDVPEDLLRYRKIQSIAEDIGLECKLDFYTSFIKRSPIETIYYWVLGKSRLLQRILPCTINYQFTKPN